MAKDDDSFYNKSFTTQESESNKSFVKKVKSRVSGFIPSSISKWFGNTESHVRQRDDSEDEDLEIRPPLKRIKSSEVDNRSHGFHANSVPSLSDTPNPSSYSNAVNSIHHSEGRYSSIFPEPKAGPSCIQSRKTLTAKCGVRRYGDGRQSEVLNGDKYSDSGESTSGYESMHKLENKNQATTDMCEETARSSKYVLNTSLSVNDKSLFAERNLSTREISSLSSRQPSFNASMFGSPNFVDRTISSKRIMNSPFYNGRTIYGGASAYGGPVARPASDRFAARNTIKIKPINQTASNHVVLSKTAKRILDALEQYTAPSAAAKKIPNPSLRRTSRLVSSSPYSSREKKVPSNRELQVPTVPDLLKMKLKRRLQDSTVSVRELATTSKSALNTEEYKIRNVVDEDAKYTNKMKTKVTAVRPKSELNEIIPEVKLPEVKLPISTLPKFDFSLPIHSSVMPLVTTNAKNTSATSTIIKTVERLSTTTFTNKVETKTSSTKTESSKTETCIVDSKEINSGEIDSCQTQSPVKTGDFKFADPVILADSLKSVTAINSFIFSEPLSKRQAKLPLEVIVFSDGKCSDNKNQTLKNANLTNYETCPTVSSSGVDGTVLSKKDECTNLDKFKPSSDTWECSVCLIRNLARMSKCEACGATKTNANKVTNTLNEVWACKTCFVINSAGKCVGCKSSKLNLPTQLEQTAGFGTQFKLNPDKWECATCLVRNYISDNKCVACTTPKVSTNGVTNTPNVTAASYFGEKFKPPVNSWECSTCMIRNRNELSKCAACESPEPAHLSESEASRFGKKNAKKDEWECDSCMVRNASDVIKCQCCGSTKPNTAVAYNIPKAKSALLPFTFGIDQNSLTNLQGFIAKPTEGQSSVPISSIFGQERKSSLNPIPTDFTFGIKPSALVKTDSEVETTDVTLSAAPQQVTDVIAESLNKENSRNKSAGLTFGTSSSTPAKLDNESKFEYQAVSKHKAVENDSSLDSTKTNSVTRTCQFVAGSSQNFDTKPGSINGDVDNKDNALFKIISNNTEQPNNIVFGSDINKGGSVPVTACTGNLFSFGAKPQVSSSLFGANASPQSSLFKFAPAETTPIMNKKPTFTSPNLNVHGSGTPFENQTVFGLNSAGSFETTAAPAFVSQSAVDVQPFTFGTPNPDESAPKISRSSFQQSTVKDTEKPKTNLFNFGSTSTAPNNIFNSATPSSVGQVESHVNYNSAPFGSSPQAGQNGSFNFGSNVKNTLKTGFNFGATQSVPAASTQGVFNFGTSSSKPGTGSSTFNFGSTGVKPNFNFTGGAPSTAFTAQPSADKPQQRLIRKAVRRTQR